MPFCVSVLIDVVDVHVRTRSLNSIAEGKVFPLSRRFNASEKTHREKTKKQYYDKGLDFLVIVRLHYFNSNFQLFGRTKALAKNTIAVDTCLNIIP